MFTLMTEANKARFARSRALVEQAYQHVEMERPPVVIQDANYSLAGEDPDTMPDDYFAEGAFAAHARATGDADREAHGDVRR